MAKAKITDVNPDLNGQVEEDVERKINVSVKLFTKDRESYSVPMGEITREEYQNIINTIVDRHGTLTGNKALMFVVSGVVHIFNVDNIICVQVYVS
jgi:hypothetical protein